MEAEDAPVWYRGDEAAAWAAGWNAALIADDTEARLAEATALLRNVICYYSSELDRVDNAAIRAFLTDGES